MRHSFLAVALGILRLSLGDIGTLLDIAPSPQTTRMLHGLGARQYVRIVGADGRGGRHAGQRLLHALAATAY